MKDSATCRGSAIKDAAYAGLIAAACVTIAAVPAGVDLAFRIVISGQVSPRCWVSSNPAALPQGDAAIRSAGASAVRCTPSTAHPRIEPDRQAEKDNAAGPQPVRITVAPSP